MEQTEIAKPQKICDFCDADLTDPWFTLSAFRWVGWNVSRSFEFRMCKQCYPKIHNPLRNAAFELMRQSFQDALAKIKQDLQKAVKDRETTVRL